MNQSRYQLIALDIDGTLLNSEKEITPDTEAMVHRAFRAGKQVVLSTGRSFAELEEILQHFPEMRYGICESGALVFDRELEQPIAVHPIPLDIVCQAAEIARQRDVLIHIFQKGRPVISRHQMEQLDAYQIPYFRSMFQRYSLQVTDAHGQSGGPQNCGVIETISHGNGGLHRNIQVGAQLPQSPALVHLSGGELQGGFLGVHQLQRQVREQGLGDRALLGRVVIQIDFFDGGGGEGQTVVPVSYTHLTLPTIA